MYKLGRILGRMGHEDLTKIKKDLEDGGFELQKIIEQKLVQYETEHSKTCSECFNDLGPYSVNNYTLIFGPDDFKKNKGTTLGRKIQVYL